MIHKRFILIVTLVSLLIANAKGQVKVAEAKVYTSHYTYNYLIQPEGEMKAILDSVYPGVCFLLQGASRAFSHYHTYSLFFIINSDTLFAGDFSRRTRIQLDLALLNDTTFKYSQETMLKSFIFLDLVEQQHNFYNGNNISVSKISFVPGVIDLAKSFNLNYRYLDPTRKYINMKAIVELNPTLTYYFGEFPVHAIKVVYEFQVIDCIIQGVKRNYIDLNRKVNEGMYMNLTQFNMSYEKDCYRRLREQKRVN